MNAARRGFSSTNVTRPKSSHLLTCPHLLRCQLVLTGLGISKRRGGTTLVHVLLLDLNCNNPFVHIGQVKISAHMFEGIYFVNSTKLSVPLCLWQCLFKFIYVLPVSSNFIPSHHIKEEIDLNSSR